MADVLHRASKECERKLENQSSAMKQAEPDASRARRLLELNERQERRQLEFQAQEAAKAAKEAEAGLLKARNELLAQIQAECQVWKDRARRAEEALDKEQTRNREGRIVLYL